MDELRKVRITEVIKAKSKKAVPIVANFQNGIYLKTQEMIAKRVEDKEKDQKFALIATPDCVYKGDITNSGSEYVDTYLAIRNRTTNEVTLTPVKMASFKHSAFDRTSSIYENNIVDSKKAIAREFGGKKAIAGYEKAKRSQPNIEVLEGTLEKQLNNLDDDRVFDKDILSGPLPNQQSAIFPELKFSSGKSVREIFNIRRLLGESIMDVLNDTAIEVLSTDQKKIKLANPFLTSSMKSIQTTAQPDSPQNVEKASILLYVDGLVRVINNRKRHWDQVEASKYAPAQLAAELRKKFSVQGNLANSKSTKQKCIIYYLILILMATDTLEVDIDSVLDEVDLTKTDLLKYAHVLGAKVKGSILYIQKVNLDDNSHFNVPISSGRRKRKGQ